MQSPDIHVTSQTIRAYNELFDVACLSGLTRLKNISLSSLLNLRDDDDHRNRQRIEIIMDEIKNVMLENIVDILLM